MADLPISELSSFPGTINDVNALFVAQKGNSAYKVTGQQFVSDLATLLQAHGGIKTISKTSTSGLVDTYTITFVDNATSTYDVTNGKGISSITTYYAVSSSNSTAPSQWSTSPQTMTNTNRYLWSYQHIVYNDESSVDTTKVVIGAYGEKGDKGDTGAAAVVGAISVKYASSSQAVNPPVDWYNNIPTVAQGDYLWTRVIVTFGDAPVTWYSVARQGVNGEPGSSAISVTLSANGWTNNAQTPSISASWLPTSGFCYVVTPAGASTNAYTSSGVYADNVTVAGQMVFHCTTVPSVDLTVNIMKVATAE